MKYLFLLGSSLSLFAPVAALAADASDLSSADLLRDDLITVTATGNFQRLDQTGQSISVMGASEIDAVQGPDLTRVLERMPGVSLSRNGGLGGFTGMRVRGADAEQLLVLVDGVRMADVSSPGGGYDLGNMLTGGIDKIELLRGSNSIVWGSQAIGGVLAMTSRELNGTEASIEYGSRDSVNVDALAGLSGDRYGLTLNGGYARTDGISSAASGTEPDGFRQWRIGGRGRVQLADGLNALLNARYADSRLDIDGFPAPAYVFADTPEYQKTREASGRAGLSYAGHGLRLDAGYALSDTRRAYYDPTYGSAPNFETQGRSERADFSGHADLPAGFTADFGADSEWSRYSTTYDAEKKARLSSGHALLGWHGDRLDLSAGARIDDHSRFGSQWTFGANGSYRVTGDWRVRASFGEGFKAPTLFQLYSDYGNGALTPEHSRSFDFGIEKGDRNGTLHFAVTAFRRDSRDLIDFVSCYGVSTGICVGRPYGTYDNVGRARSEGVEVEADARLIKTLSIHAAYSYVKAVNRTTGSPNLGHDLARRPRHALSLAADWTTPLHGLTLGGDLRVVGHSFDDAGNFTRMNGYALVSLRASLPVTDQIELFGRVENLGDKRYQTAAGYGANGRSAFIGARARF